jgi:acetyltransferase-like isoleucine patch superfamily enzyme
MIDSFKRILASVQKTILEKSSTETRIKYLRKQGVKIGLNCSIETMSFSTEPFLIEIGNHVAISSGTEFITHDGSVWCMQQEVDGQIFGKIKIGNNVFIGINCTILYNTSIGNNCIIGAGSVVRGQFPDNSVIFGNPAKVFLKTNMQKMFFLQNPGLVKTNNLTPSEAHKLVKKHFGVD